MSDTPVRKILILAANPRNTSHLRLDQELRDIAEGLQRAQQRNQFTLEQRLAVRPRDVQRSMLDISPQIVHFSGHGEGEEGLVFEDDTGNAKFVDGAALAGMFALFAEQVECVVLNGCYSEVQAKAIAEHIPYVIGMSQSIGDQAAIEFAVGFYDALGAGRTIEFAYKLGCSAIRLAGIAEYLTPVLMKKSESGAAVTQLIPPVEPPPLVSPPSASITEQPVMTEQQLNGSERRQLHEALLKAFPTRSNLAQLTSFEMNKSLDAIAGGENYSQVVFNLINWAEAEGRLEELLVAARKQNPGNQMLQEFVAGKKQ